MSSPLSKLTQGRPWHTNALLVLLAVWVAWATIGLVFSLVAAPSGMLGLLDYYIFFSIPGLMAFGTYLLFVKSFYSFAPFMFLPLMYMWSAVRIYPALSPARWQLDGAYLSQFPTPLLFGAGFFAACAIYCAFLNRRAARPR
jgi:hypothetical protein